MELTLLLKAEANRLGFSLVGIAPATDAETFAQFEAWLDAGHHATMEYLPNHREARRHPEAILPKVRSVVMLGFEYASEPDNDRIAAYAQGPDYHRFLWDKQNQLAKWLEIQQPGTLSRGVTDSAPLLERDFARRAGLGWFGKNTMLINKSRGSFFFLGALLTTAELVADSSHTSSHCGTCTACLDACPTQAFPSPGVLDARKCISYLTIEHRGPIAVEQRPGIGGWLFGCDVCQDVCPWNRNHATRQPPFPHRPDLAAVDALRVIQLSAEDFKQQFRGTSFERTKRDGLVRNAAIVLGNTAGLEVLPIVQAVAETDPCDFVREAALWAIAQIRQRSAGQSAGDFCRAGIP